MVRFYFVLFSIAMLGAVIWLANFIDIDFYWALVLAFPLIGIGLYDTFQTHNNVLRNYPLIGHIKQPLVKNRKLLQDWIFESNIEGRPFNWVERTIIYSRAENTEQTSPFGTQLNYKENGYEWILHSNHPGKEIEEDLRILVGGPDCTQPYSCSILNVGAMSYGSISDHATLALNAGAKLGNFASNTGEGGLTEYHLKYGGDLILQFGTAYFGFRDENGNFSEEEFRRQVVHPSIKMVEIKISQGAKPGYGAILPAKKVTPDIAKIRDVEPYKTVVSPPGHTAFQTPVELMYFIKKLRTLSGGKPIGYKFCLGQQHEFIAMCKAMIQTGIKPDYIAIDGGEGGTGAAHFDSINWVGIPLEDAIPFVYNTLVGFDLKKDIKIFSCGKVISSFHIVKMLSLGADAVYSARGMMFALGCVQAYQCNKDTCPTGITTMKRKLVNGLVVNDKKERVYYFHKNTITGVKEMLRAAGLQHTEELNRAFVCRRVNQQTIKTLDQIYPYLPKGCLLCEPYPANYQKLMAISAPDSFNINLWQHVEMQKEGEKEIPQPTEKQKEIEINHSPKQIPSNPKEVQPGNRPEKQSSKE